MLPSSSKTQSFYHPFRRLLETEFKHLYLLDNTSALDSSDEVPSLEQALYNVLPTGLRNTIRKQNYGNDPERE